MDACDGEGGGVGRARRTVQIKWMSVRTPPIYIDNERKGPLRPTEMEQSDEFRWGLLFFFVVLLAAAAALAFVHLQKTVRRLRRRQRRHLSHRNSNEKRVVCPCSCRPGLNCASSTGTSGTVVPATATLRWERTAFVDNKYGSDTSGRVERADLPFRTIQAAVDAAGARAATDTSKWQVWIRPGIYTENVTLSTGVDLFGQSPAASGTSTQDVIVDGQVIWTPVAFAASTELLIQGIQVSATDLPAFSATSSLEGQSVTWTQCTLLSTFTIATTSPAITYTTTVAVQEGPDMTYTFNHCVLANHIAHTTSTVPKFNAAVVSGAPVGLNLLRSQLWVTITIPEGPQGADYPVEFVRHIPAGVDSVLTSVANQYTYFMLPEIVLAPVSIVCFSQIGTSTDAEEMRVVSEADLFSTGPPVDDIKSGPPHFIVSQVGTGAALSANVQNMLVQTDFPISTSSSTLFVDTVSDASCEAYFRDLLWRGLSNLAVPATFDETLYRLRQIDIVTDTTQSGQFFPGTVTVVTANYNIVPTDTFLLVNPAGPITINLPSAIRYPGRSVIIRNVSAQNVTVVSPSNPGGDFGAGWLLGEDSAIQAFSVTGSNLGWWYSNFV
jgi:hypothetical protein